MDDELVLNDPKIRAILDRVIELFYEFGIRNLNMDDISSKLKISKKTLYQYFKSKEDLIEKLESTANFMRGMRFDPRLHHEIRDAITERVAEIDLFIEQYMDDLLK